MIADKVIQLANEAQAAGELRAAGVLLVLAGAMRSGALEQLFNICGDFAARDLERMDREEAGAEKWQEFLSVE